MDEKALYKIESGLCVAISKTIKDNGCIINTLMQVCFEPKKVIVSLNNINYTTNMIAESRKLNVCILDNTVPFNVVENFGFNSGKSFDKFNIDYASKANNGLMYLNKYSNAYLSLNVDSTINLGSHTLFICDVEDAKALNDNPTCSYDYYHKHVKKAPVSKKTKGYRCSVCGYVYEGEILPDDFICPICYQGVDVFVKIEE